ncbi:hypothetical protein [Hyperthermus butylicus]|uniref:Uncharacterized protein n=1 Tax=Hyperthermus butylicus (strain DSM 5456 / JCM 9403 / PLM1-5) TaxID=415426 RepID=A2BLB0_HYPBU|nr:hypothetical protein [Hyperthermus butylicus]ABM80771.1 hypothetical protein Hbut_0923 [Hyperthermus butylicus DSM 5456]
MAPEALAEDVRRIMRGKGLEVSETRSRQATLDGEMIGYHSVSGYKQGSYKVTVRLSPEPASTTVVINAASEQQAQSAATRLEKLGFNVDVEGERVHASIKTVQANILSKAIDIAEEASKQS